jgi:hypothetical protein
MVVAYDLTCTKEEEEFFNSKDIKPAIQLVCRHCGKCSTLSYVLQCIMINFIG